jgi:acid phosphatase
MLAIHWWRNSAERTALFLQGYALAGERVRALSAREARERWAVILDADETTLDNSTYQLRRNGQNLAYSSESWAVWVHERAAPATPGSAAFTHLVHQLGGRVVIVTNRDDEVCADTRANLQQVGVEADLVLCRVNRVSDKNPRFQAVQSGTGTGLPALHVLLWVGDNIQDFPGGAQALLAGAPGSLAEIGRSWVILPNPMYGSWESLPVN